MASVYACESTNYKHCQQVYACSAILLNCVFCYLKATNKWSVLYYFVICAETDHFVMLVSILSDTHRFNANLNKVIQFISLSIYTLHFRVPLLFKNIH